MAITHRLIAGHLTTAIKLLRLVPTLHRPIPPALPPTLASNLISPNKHQPPRIHPPTPDKPVHKLDSKVNLSGKIYNRQEGICDFMKDLLRSVNEN